MSIIPGLGGFVHLWGRVLKKNHLSKKIAPVIVSLCLIAYYVLILFIILKLDIPNIIKTAIIIVSILVTLVIIKVLIERIKEIDGGEEDDLGKY